MPTTLSLNIFSILIKIGERDSLLTYLQQLKKFAEINKVTVEWPIYYLSRMTVWLLRHTKSLLSSFVRRQQIVNSQQLEIHPRFLCLS